MSKTRLFALAILGLLYLLLLTPGGSMIFSLDSCVDDTMPGKYSLEKEGVTYKIIFEETYTGFLTIDGEIIGEFTWEDETYTSSFKIWGWEVEDKKRHIFLHGHSDLFDHLNKLYWPSYIPSYSGYEYYAFDPPACYLGLFNKRSVIDHDLYTYFKWEG